MSNTLDNELKKQITYMKQVQSCLKREPHFTKTRVTTCTYGRGIGKRTEARLWYWLDNKKTEDGAATGLLSSSNCDMSLAPEEQALQLQIEYGLVKIYREFYKGE